MNAQMPEIGKLAIGSHKGDSQQWTKQTGLIVDKEYNPMTKDFLWGVMFADGKMTWGGNIALDVIGWPE